MKHVEKHIMIAGEELILSNYRAMFWSKMLTLIISDVHIGKSAHFRRHGIPISSEVQQKDLDRLSFLIDYFKADHLIVVGDLFHAGKNSDFNGFRDWRIQYKHLKITLIKGNHDRLKQIVYDDFDIDVKPQFLHLEPFKFIHEPELYESSFCICGHIHPGYLLQVKGQPRIKLPCFQRSERQIILPAFSEFTGLAISEFQKDYTFYAFSNSSFFEFN
ncbi:MAG: ligase-associated DNA damage response endonuclease PdeM [Psychroserpens sp.]|nr:ligase-associated DNA damage response endonuclease PdeM [Psychroserpens sp.]